MWTKSGDKATINRSQPEFMAWQGTDRDFRGVGVGWYSDRAQIAVDLTYIL